MTADGHPARAWRILARLIAIALSVGARILVTLPIVIWLRLVRGREPAHRRAHQAVVTELQRLGPTFVKFGQIAAARTDVLPAGLCHELSRLHDSVAPMSRRQLRRSLTAASQACPELSGLHLDPEPVGSGSIAGVYRAFAPRGEMLALKLKRPGIDRRMRDDLALIEAFARLGQWLPKLRGMPIADLVGYMSQAILGQLDFGRELRHGEEIRRALCGVPGVVVPRAHAALSSAHCLAFDFVSGLDRRTPRWLPAKVRMQLARRMLAVVHELFFVHGLVHCDLHPGNLYVTIHRQVVVLDAGYCVRLPDAVRRLVGEFFARLATGDGRRCGEIVLASAVNLTADTNTSGFIAEFTKLVAETAGPENRFDMAAFGDAVYGLQQRYRIYAASDFAFPLMSLLVADGTVRRLTADVDFQLVGAGVSKPRAGVSNTEEDASAAGGYVGARPSLASQERA